MSSMYASPRNSSRSYEESEELDEREYVVLDLCVKGLNGRSSLIGGNSGRLDFGTENGVYA